MFSFAEDAVGPGATLKGEKNGRVQLLGPSMRSVACVDPQTRCGAMLIYLDQLVIVPFRSSSMELSFFDEDDDDDDDDEDEEDREPEDIDGDGGSSNNGRAAKKRKLKSKKKKAAKKSVDGSNGSTFTDPADPDIDDEEEEDEEEQKLVALVKETKQRGMTSDMTKRLQNLLDKSVKIGVKRKRNHMAGVLSTELTGREFLLRLRELDITGRVIDVAFLDGYLEPTLMILHEENEKNSTSGRFAAGYDTYCLTVLSINLNTRLHPKIWTVQNLPSDCFRLIPCRTPVGGVVILSANAILYFNQTQFFGLATNRFAEMTVNQGLYSLQEAVYEDGDGHTQPLNLLLENCEFGYLGSTEILLTMPSGDYFVLSLPYEDPRMRMWRAGADGSNRDANSADQHTVMLRLRQLPSGPTASCVCVDEDRRTLFIGSRSGDSVLCEFTQERRSDETGLGMNGVSGESGSGASEVVDPEAGHEEEDEEDIFLYGSSSNGQEAASTDASDASITVSKNSDSADALHHLDRYVLRPLDVLPGIGQVTSMDMGVERNADSNECREQLVVGGGFMTSGAVSVLHGGLRPIVSTEVELSGCRAMWTVASSLESDSPGDQNPKRRYNAYLILSVAQRTMVLKTGEDMEPLEANSGFYTSGPTLAAANLFGHQRIVQVFKQGVRVMMEVPVEKSSDEKPENDAEEAGGSDSDEGPQVRLVCTQEVSLDGDIESGGMNVDSSTVSIVSVDVIDPYILVLLTDGTIRVLMGDEEDMELTVIAPEVRYDGTETGAGEEMGICAGCLFYDWAGMFADSSVDENSTHEQNKSKKSVSASDEEPPQTTTDHEDTDDEDDAMESALYSTTASRLSSRDASDLREAEHHDDESVSRPLLPRDKAAMMCGVCFDDGSLHVYSLPDFKKRGIFPYLTFAPHRLVNTLMPFRRNAESEQFNQKGGSHQHAQPSNNSSAPALGINAHTASANDGRIRKSHTVNSPVADLAIHRLGASDDQQQQLNVSRMARMVLLVFLANGDLLVYAALPDIRPAQSKLKSPLFQFVRITTDLITRPFLPPKTRSGPGSSGPGQGGDFGATTSETNATAAVLAKLRAGFRYPMLTRFDNVNNRSGVFFRGAHPMWILSERGMPTLVPMNVTSVARVQKDGRSPSVSVPVLSFTPFHHWNCPNGFIFFHSSGALRVCELPSSKTTTILPSSGGIVLHKVEIGASVHHMLYMGRHGPGGVAEALELPTYAVVCSRPMLPADVETAVKQAQEEDEENGVNNGTEGGDENGDPNEPYVSTNTNNVMAPTAEMYPDLRIEEMVHTEENVYELRLVQTNEMGDWERRGVFRVYFQRFEVVLSVKVMYLCDASQMKENGGFVATSADWYKRRKPYVVIGTGFVGPHGEDESGKGRLLLYELDYAQYTTAEGETSAKLPKLRLIFIKEHHHGAISFVSQLGPHVLAAVGMKLIVYEFKSDQLTACAFYDAQMYIVSLSVIKDYVMYADVYKSVHFLRWREKQRQLQLLAKDYEPLAITATEFSVAEKKLALLAGDMEENLHVMQFAPQDIESRGGQRLLRTSDFHLGVQITSMIRKATGTSNPPAAQMAGHRKHQEQPSQSQYVTLLGSSEGSVGAIMAVGERVFRRLFTLQNVMINTLPQNCALNPREFRMMKSNGGRRTGRPDAWCKQKWKKGFLDGHVLFRFLHLDYVAQKELARCIGTTPEVIIHNLLEVQRMTSSFL
ncbi:hypothetical protein PINS_up000948 [Pythium insidiosum]|nr:hypothetical protein PINS_up000948 [Pythium insidiosum]